MSICLQMDKLFRFLAHFGLVPSQEQLKKQNQFLSYHLVITEIGNSLQNCYILTCQWCVFIWERKKAFFSGFAVLVLAFSCLFHVMSLLALLNYTLPVVASFKSYAYRNSLLSFDRLMLHWRVTKYCFDVPVILFSLCSKPCTLLCTVPWPALFWRLYTHCSVITLLKGCSQLFADN